MNETEEMELKMRVEGAYELGKPMTRRDIQEAAYDIIKQRLGERARIPGAKWTRLFYRRHQLLSKIANGACVRSSCFLWGRDINCGHLN